MSPTIRQKGKRAFRVVEYREVLTALCESSCPAISINEPASIGSTGNLAVYLPLIIVPDACAGPWKYGPDRQQKLHLSRLENSPLRVDQRDALTVENEAGLNSLAVSGSCISLSRCTCSKAAMRVRVSGCLTSCPLIPGSNFHCASSTGSGPAFAPHRRAYRPTDHATRNSPDHFQIPP